MKVAVVHDWLDTLGGSEQVLEQILSLYPDADLYLVVDFMAKAKDSPLNGHRIESSFIQRLPFARRRFRNYLPLMPFAIRQFDLSGYDLVLSSSHCVAKGVKSHPGQVHICYCHTPMRYIWDMEQDYLQDNGITGAKALLVRYLFHRLRQWDVHNHGVDFFVANSQFIAERIRKCYDRDATVIYPPVDVDRFELCEAKEDYYVVVSRLVSQKKVELIVEAFARMKDKKLVVVGDGPCMDAVRRVATRNVTVTGHLPLEAMRSYLKTARAFVFASLEDFGMVMVEAQACGTPVIAYGKGGALEIVTPETGLFFEEQSAASIVAAVKKFESGLDQFSPRACHENAQRFRRELFLESYAAFIRQKTSSPGTAGAGEIDSDR